jgi:hypothetical protein
MTMTKIVFTDQSTIEDEFFYEGPERKPDLYKGSAYTTSHVNVIGINTTDIDKYRQGVEITRNIHANKNVYRIYSGESNHKTYPNAFGQVLNFRTTATVKYIENVPLTPVEWLSFTGEKLFKEQLVESTISENQNERFMLNGVIEPLAIRYKITRMSIDIPFESHDVRASLMNGNQNIFFGSSQILSVERFEPGGKSYPFLDLYIDDLPQKDAKKYYEYSAVAVSPFVDRQKTFEIEQQVTGDDMKEALADMNKSGAGYVQFNEISARTGYVFSTKNNVGVDSIAFGDLTHF